MRLVESCDNRVRVIESLRRLSLSLILLFSFLGFAQPRLDDHVPGVKVRPAGTVMISPERQPRRDPAGGIHAVIAGHRSVFTAVFIYSFLRFDRKQNTRLWPFVPMGTARAPPATFLL